MHWRKPQSTGAGRDLKKITRYRFRVFSGRDEVTPSFPFSPFFTSESAQTSRRLPSDGGRLGFDPWSAADTKIIVDTPRRRSPSSTLLTAPTPGSSHALASVRDCILSSSSSLVKDWIFICFFDYSNAQKIRIVVSVFTND
ncbi:hypothetical protein MUK42_33895 [Musa troglodytarum]|uniref:Uncharacterized protein n=1 Tax=Musa troglodytarum TaxID=320322 RepID=A0A9E7G0I4_9LILI|nr:hypothetical protein MUK42_33895 [Musa troglodytarum]